MQLIKLNRRFRACRAHGHAIALEFEGYAELASVIEGRMMNTFGSQFKDQPQWRCATVAPGHLATLTTLVCWTKAT